VEPNQLLDVERLRADVGAVLELSDVLLVADGEDVTVGQPRVTGARVVAEVMEHGRGPKLIVFKYKNKTRYRKKTGHRQAYTRLAIRQILIGAEPVAAAAAPAKPRQRRAPTKLAVEAKEAPPEIAKAAAAEAPEAAAEAAATPPVAEPAPKARRRRAAAPKATEEAPPEIAKAAAAEAPEAAAEAAEIPPVGEPAPEAAAPEEAPKARRRRAAAPKATEEAPPKPARPRAAGRTKREE
jgi:large subunit ribosomal protein L21